LKQSLIKSRNLATQQSRNLATKQSRNLATQQSRNLSTQQSRNLATQQSRNLATQPCNATITQQSRNLATFNKKHYFPYFKGSMIGVIIGVVLAVILLIVAVGLLVFAKASGRWCFADDYEDVNAKQNPRSQMGRGPMPPANQQAQVYRFIPFFHSLKSHNAE
jgi:hypothetical protein